MIFLFTFVYWILEAVWDLLTGASSKPKPKVKSKIQSSSAEDVKPAEKTAEGKKKRDKIE